MFKAQTVFLVQRKFNSINPNSFFYQLSRISWSKIALTILAVVLMSQATLANQVTTIDQSSTSYQYQTQTTYTYQQAKDYLTPEVLARAYALINKNYYSWNYTFVLLAAGKISPHATPQSYTTDSFVEQVMVRTFYRGINAREPIDIKNNRLYLPAFKEYAELNAICQVVANYPDLNALVLSHSNAPESFCRAVAFYYDVFVQPFTLDQVQSMQALAVKQYIPEYRWRLIQLGRMGFKYELPTINELRNSPLAPYLAE